MSSKAEKTSNRSRKHSGLSIYFRNPLLLKVVAWLGGLSFIGSTGVVWADLKPNAPTADSTATSLVSASPAAEAAKTSERDIYGPFLPVVKQQSPNLVAPDKLPNREVPTAVSPGAAKISPTGTIVRPQHTDVTVADNYTVGVKGATSRPNPAEEIVEIEVPAPLSKVIPSPTAEVATMTRSQVKPQFDRPPASISQPPQFVRPPASISQSVPTASIQTQRAAHSTTTRSVPQVSTLPTNVASPQRASITNNVVAPMRPSTIPGRAMPQLDAKPAPSTTPPIAATVAKSPTAVDISVPQPISKQYEVRPVARLPIVSDNRVVPTVPAIPSVRPAATAAGQANSRPLAFANANAADSYAQLIYPLSSPAPTTSNFGWRTHPITGSRRFHSGIDIGAPMGAPVVAAGSGTIVSAGWQGGYGKAIVIQHNGVQQTLYGHLSEIFVQPGQTIEQGMVIGRVGSTGNSTGPHLHYEIRMSSNDGWVAVDPREEIRYALDNLRRSMPFAQTDLPPGYN